MTEQSKELYVFGNGKLKWLMKKTDMQEGNQIKAQIEEILNQVERQYPSVAHIISTTKEMLSQHREAQCTQQQTGQRVSESFLTGALMMRKVEGLVAEKMMMPEQQKHVESLLWKMNEADKQSLESNPPTLERKLNFLKICQMIFNPQHTIRQEVISQLDDHGSSLAMALNRKDKIRYRYNDIVPEHSIPERLSPRGRSL